MKKTVLILGSIVGLCVILYFAYFSNLRGLDPKVITYYKELKQKLKEKGYDDNMYVVSTTRWKGHNELLHYLNTGAAKHSVHLKSKAMDVIVRDINQDGRSDREDVLIVKLILEDDIVRNKGGVGSYLKSDKFFSRQMVHFDCRGYKARWDY
jgi:uncharacterized protein YcbK (DUF882 family)